MFPEKIIYVGILINLVSQFFYIRSMLLGHTKPNLVSWVIWMLAPLIGFFFAIKGGAGLSALPIFMAGFGPLLVVITSIFNKQAYWKINTFDIICGIFSILALILYVFTHNLGVSILFAILSDLLAGIPTLTKCWKFPETESGSIYLGGLISNTLALFIITNWSFPIYAFNVYVILHVLSVLFCIYRKKITSIFS